MIFAISPIGVFEDGKTFQLDVNVASKPGSKIKINSAQLTRDNQDIELIRFAEIAQWKSLQKSLSYQSLDWHEIHKNRNSQLEINFSTMDRNGHIQTVSQRWKLNTKTTRKTEAGLKSI